VVELQEQVSLGHVRLRQLAWAKWNGEAVSDGDLREAVELVPEQERSFLRWELGLQSAFADPSPLPNEVVPEPLPPPVPKQQLSFAWWKTWGKPKEGKDGKVKTRWAKCAPIRGHAGYARALAYYLEKIASAWGGNGKTLSDISLQEALGIIRSLRWRKHTKRGGHVVKTVSSPADCGVLWYGNEAGARPCGCGDNDICSLCGPAEADYRARVASEIMYGEFLLASQGLVGKLECMGSGWTVPLHKVLSANLERLWELDPKTFRVELNRVLTDMWAVVELAYPEGKIGGYQSVQTYGESNPGEAHFHGHHVVAPVMVEVKVGAVRSKGKGWVPESVKPLPGFVSPETLEKMRLEWGRRQIVLAKRWKVPLTAVGVKYDEAGKPFLVGDVQLRYFGLKKGYDKALKAAKGYLQYQSRWPGQDLVEGLKGDGETYTWTGPVGKKPEGATASYFTGMYTSTKQAIYQRQLSPEDLVKAIWRMDKWPEKYPRLRWRGCLSTSNVKEVMGFLGWEEKEAEPPAVDEIGYAELLELVSEELEREAAELGLVREEGESAIDFVDRVLTAMGSGREEGEPDGELLVRVAEQVGLNVRLPCEVLKPVGRTAEGLLFRADIDGVELLVRWKRLALEPAALDGGNLWAARKKVWGPKVRDGPG